MRIAFISDIHGNLPALEAVLVDLKTQAPDQVYFAGDLLNRCPWTHEILDLYRDLGWPGVMGNHDLILATLNTERSHPAFEQRARFPTLWWTWTQLTPAEVALLRALPDELPIRVPGLPDLRLAHGVPGNAFVGIYPESPDAEIANYLASVVEPVYICGHAHRVLDRVSGRWHVVNAGSVGLPYDGDARAQYVILDGVQGRWQVTVRRVAYDLERVRAAFAASPMQTEVGPVVELYLRTAMTGHPYASDFGSWLRTQPDTVKAAPNSAVATYLRHHGPGRWAFSVGPAT